MSDIKIGYSDYVRFSLKAENRETFWMNEEPIGWNDDELELDRHKDYHGIFIQFSNKLKFYGDAKDYIEEAYFLGGPNTKLRLTKEITKDTIDDNGNKTVKWVERYNAIADMTTKVINDDMLEINFNNNDLAELIKSHEDDSFELERKTSIDDDEIEGLDTLTTELKTRTISGSGEQILNLDTFETDVNGDKFQEVIIGDTGFVVAKTKIVTQGSERHTAVYLDGEFPETNPTSAVAQEALWFSDNTVDIGTVTITFFFNFLVKLRRRSLGDNWVTMDIVRYQWNGTGFDETYVKNLVNNKLVDSYTAYTTVIDITGVLSLELAYNEGICFRWRSSGAGKNSARFYSQNINFTTEEFYESTPSIKFLFTHDVYERLMYIMTGEKNRFYSKFFGRTELGYQVDGITEKGEIGGGLIGMTSGFWVRDFNPESEKYKSMQVSLKNLIDSCTAVFNVGVGIETVNFKERLRVEELKYFYRKETVVRLPYQVTKEKYSIDSKLLFSGTELGYKYGGDYENEIGLDEPNTVTNTVTPIRVSKTKYKQTSEVRADEYGLEITRRKPQRLFPDEDTSMDEHNWFLDLKRSADLQGGYEQAEYTDRLEANTIPYGIHSPETFRSMIFTPLRLLFRHGWIIRSCLEWYKSKKIVYTKGKANVNLAMQFPGEPEYSENSDIEVSALERSRFTPDIVEFEHPVDEDLIDQIFGTTRIIVNGEEEEIPNFYFKFEWINGDGEILRGYLLNFKPKGVGKFKMRLANERV